MADTDESSVTAHDSNDPYEFYRTPVLDPNDPDLTAQMKMQPVFGDSGNQIDMPGHISADQLEEVADKSKHVESGPRGFSHNEVMREMLERRGIRTEAPRGRKYFT